MLFFRSTSPLRRGQAVRVRTEAEIASTLDGEGKLDGMPFMPEMAKYCGQCFRVYRRAERTCFEGSDGNSFRRLRGTVLLEGMRCKGEQHDGCQRNCTFFWKEAWLVPVAEGAQDAKPLVSSDGTEGLSEWARRLPTRTEDRYRCQSTELFGATQGLSRWSIAPFLAEVRAGELSVWRLIEILASTIWKRLLGVIRLKRSAVAPELARNLSRGDLNLKTGDWVEVKPVPEIQGTLDAHGKNRGLSFAPDMVQFVEGKYQVEFPIQKIILEHSGKMIALEHTVALKGVACSGQCTNNCPRNSTLYWRESWLKRAESVE